jgi:TPR repeat protein
MLTRHNNRSEPYLVSDHPQYEQAVPSIPSFDPSATLGLAALRLSDPDPPGTSTMSYTSDHDSAPMSGTSNLRSRHAAPRHANTLPPAPNHALPPRTARDNLSRSSGSSRQNSRHDDPDDSYESAYDAYFDVSESDYGPTQSYNDQMAAPVSNGYVSPNAGGYPERPLQAQPAFFPSTSSDYNDPLYSAASSVLGMGPPGVAPPIARPPTASGYSNHHSLTGAQSSISASQSGPYAEPPGTNSYPQGASYTSYSIPQSSNTSILDAGEFERRPTLQRTGTSASISLRTQTTKAVDLSAPPYTKEYIDQYRQRIKADPDPEAHFLFAKYLIEAAKHIGANAKDQRTVKKFRDMLIAESLKVIRRLATQGQAYDEAQFFLANCYGTGTLGLQVDHERAYHLYLQAAKQNHPAAAYRVAVCNEIGAGTRRELPRAAAFYRKAASLGDTPAMYKLGMILLHGTLGEAKNPRDAINWLKRAAEQADEDNPHALHELGLLHETVNSPLVPYDPVYAKNLFTKAAHLGYTLSQHKLGQCYEYGTLTCPVDPRRSIAWYTKAAEKGDSDAELALSGWYLTGSEGVLKQSDSEAYLWARRAANKGLSKAEYAVGYYAEVGIGIKQDIEFAKRWYMRAAGMSSNVS